MLAGCPDDDAIDRFVVGTADDGLKAVMWEHLPACSACRRLVSELARSPEPAPPPEAELAGGGPLLRGTAVGRYLILDLIGSGAMGRVYAAYDPQLDRKVALKLVKLDGAGADPALLRVRMLREAQAMARLAHPNVVAVHDAGDSGGQIHIAMELVEGRNLRAWLAEGARPWREVLAVVVQAGHGLAAAHGAGLVHRDFKPDNILIADDGRVLVGDFGMASVGAARGGDVKAGGDLLLTQTGMLMGTPAYMAPEQLSSARVDVRADIYAFSVSAWEALHGEHPFGARDLAGLLAAAATGRPREPARSAVPGRLRRALAAAMHPDPAARPQTLEPLLEALAADPRRKLARAALVVVGVVALASLGLAARAVVAAQTAARRAEARAASASRIGQELKERELRLDEERLLPLHDLRPAAERVRAGLGEMRALLDGSAADAPVHDAIGRELVALGDYTAARPELEAALAMGAGGPDLHWVLGLTLLRLRDQALDDARRMGGPTWVAARQAALDAEYLPQARRHLELATGTTLAPPELLAAMLAYQAGDLDTALARARAAARRSPVYHQAQALVGEILLAQSEAASARADPNADTLLDQAIAELEAAARLRRSDAEIFDAIARAWIHRLDVRRWESLLRRLPSYNGALLAAYREVAVAPDRGRGYARVALAHALAVELWTPGSAPLLAGSTQACIVAATAAAARDPLDALAREVRGICLVTRAQLVADTGEDPTPAYGAAATALFEAQVISPGFPWASNDLGAVYEQLANDRLAVGRDARPAVRVAIAFAKAAILLDPAYLAPRLNLAYDYDLLAAAGVSAGTWDDDAEAQAAAAVRAAAALPDHQDWVAAGNRLILLNAKLEYDAAAGHDCAPAARSLVTAMDEFRSLWPPGTEGGEAELLLLEARATLAVVRAEAGAAAVVDRAPFDRCLAIQPRRFECRALAIRAGWAAGDLAGAHARAERLTVEFPRSGRAFAMLAETERRLGHVEAGTRAAKAAIARAPELAAAHAALGQLEAMSARDSAGAGQALAALELAVARNPLLARRVAADRAAMVALVAAAAR